MTLKNKLIVLLVLPLAGIVFLGTRSYFRSSGTSTEMADFKQLPRLASRIGNLVHESQKERGTTAGYLSSKGKNFSKALPTQREQTDKRIAEMREFLATFDVAPYSDKFRSTLDDAVTLLDAIADKRKAVTSQQISTSDAVAYYTSMNSRFLDLIALSAGLTSDSGMSVQIAAFVNVLQAKERAGIERAVLTGAFAADRFTPEAYARFNSLVTTQETYFRTYRSTAPTNDLAAFDKTL
ncbi:MAG: hypothetical protein CMJ48_13970, partial [Planctomycetaceae bacterium]|nr:hypothetical protein [Planctomycetaceae bacterium]